MKKRKKKHQNQKEQKKKTMKMQQVRELQRHGAQQELDLTRDRR